MEARDGERGERAGVAGEARGDVDDGAVGVVARQLGKEGVGRLAAGRVVEVRERRREARDLTPLPERPRRPHRVALERGVRGGARAAELGVQVVDDPAHRRKLAVDLARERGRIRGEIEAQVPPEHLEHRVERSEPAAERLRLGELGEDADPGGRWRREEREGAARESDAVVRIRRRAVPLAQDDDAPRPAREERGRSERTNARAEDGDVIVLRHRLRRAEERAARAGNPYTRTPRSPSRRGSTRTRPSAHH